MFCPECGANQPDGTKFCGECGASIGAPQQNPPQQAAPVYQAYPNQPVYHASPVNPVDKKTYLSTMATPKTKTMSKLVLLLTLVCLVVMIIGHVTLVNTSIEEISIIETMFDIAGEDTDEFDELKDEMEYYAEFYEEVLEYAEDDLNKKEIAAAEELIETMDACSDKFSISNMSKLFKAAEKVSDTDAADYFDLDSDFDELDDVVEIMDTASTSLLISAIMSLLFTIIGGLCRINGLVIAGCIFSSIFCIVMYGFLFLVLNLVAHIALIKVQGDVNREYKDYRNGTLPLSA